MSILNKVKVNTRYTRSINLERDASSTSVVEAYIPTMRAIRTLESMNQAFKADESPRAWSLVGPYGSGKSAFAVYLAHLLGDQSEVATEAAFKKLNTIDLGLSRRYRNLTKDTEGYCTVLLTGSPDSLSRRLVQSLSAKADDVWARKRGPTPSIVSKLAYLAKRKEPPTTNEVLECVSELQDKLANRFSGLLIVIDELGKFLEYEARHYGANDIFLLQALAERALGYHSVKLSLVVMLHQAFEQYARSLGESLRNEWAKVQGRFENIPFLESSEQVLRVVGAAIEHDFSKTDQREVSSAAASHAKVLANLQALPSSLDEATAAELFTHCYPLHPVSALLLPILCQKVAQNERTLFSYLGSHEAHGFQESLNRCEKIGDWIYPWEIYEYFILNQPAALSDHITHRRWAEVVTAVERLGDSTPEDAQLLKSIGLLNIIGTQGNFKASKEIVELCLPTKSAVKKSISNLVNKSILQYRKFNTEYRVWQGSDFDLDSHVVEALSKIGQFSIAEKLNNRHSLLPIVARRYTIQNGTLRYFVPLFADAENYKEHEARADKPRLIFFLAESQDDVDRFHSHVLGYYSLLDMVVLCRNGDLMREALGEVLALEEVLHSAQALNSDPVAKREFNDRYTAALSKESDLLARLTDEPSQNDWYCNTEPLSIEGKRSLQAAMSSVLEKVYHATPVIMNELINRDKPSSQANAARNKLAIAMFANESQMDLGFEKFPPEKAIYRAMFQASKLHTETENGTWQFQGPVSKARRNDPCNYFPVWKRIDEFLDSTEQTPKSFVELNKELLSPPYGIKEGVLPILYLSVLAANQEELAIYEARRYTPHLSPEQVERFLKRPDEFTIQRFRISGVNKTLLQKYSKALFTDGQDRGLLALAKPIAKFIGELPEYTQRTNRLPPEATAVRDAFKLAKSPVGLLLEDIPKALGISLNNRGESAIEALPERLTNVLRELKYCHQQLREEMKGLLAQAFGADKNSDLKEIRELIRGRCTGLEQYTVDVEGLRAFILRLTKTSDDHAHWLDNILMFLGKKPSDKWNDQDRDGAEYRLGEFSRKLNDLEKLRIHDDHYRHTMQGDFDVYLLRSIKRGGAELDQVVAIDKRRQELANSARENIKSVLSALGDNELSLAALAQVVDEFLSEYSSSKKVDKIAAAQRGIKPLRGGKG